MVRKASALCRPRRPRITGLYTQGTHDALRRDFAPVCGVTRGWASSSARTAGGGSVELRGVLKSRGLLARYYSLIRAQSPLCCVRVYAASESRRNERRTSAVLLPSNEACADLIGLGGWLKA